MMKKGIDVSKYQKDIDWQKVKKDGIEFAIIRIGYGKYDNQKDPYFEKNYEGAKKVGIPVGVYHYSYAKTVDEAKLEAGLVLTWLKNRKLDLPVYFDIEDKSQASLDKKLLNEICKAFCNRIEAAGYWAGIYSNKNWAINLIDGFSLGKRYTYWIAQYNTKCTYLGNYDIWQYSSSGKVNGINGKVDMNYMYRDLVSVISGKKNGNTPKNQTNSKTNNIQKTQQTKSSTYKGSSLVDYLKSIGIDSSFTNRKKIAYANGIKNYTGTASQNTTLLKKIRGNNTNTSKTYIVKNGDTLSGIAKKYNTTWQKIYKDNKSIIGNNPNIIKPGMNLTIK